MKRLVLLAAVFLTSSLSAAERPAKAVSIPLSPGLQAALDALGSGDLPTDGTARLVDFERALAAWLPDDAQRTPVPPELRPVHEQVIPKLTKFFVRVRLTKDEQMVSASGADAEWEGYKDQVGELQATLAGHPLATRRALVHLRLLCSGEAPRRYRDTSLIRDAVTVIKKAPSETMGPMDGEAGSQLDSVLVSCEARRKLAAALTRWWKRRAPADPTNALRGRTGLAERLVLLLDECDEATGLLRRALKATLKGILEVAPGVAPAAREIHAETLEGLGEEWEHEPLGALLIKVADRVRRGEAAPRPDPSGQKSPKSSPKSSP
jgi:hypothetical protein